MTEGSLPKKRTTLYIDGNVLNHFKKVCDREDVSMSEKTETFWRRYVDVHMEGNPQLRLAPFMGEVKKLCYRCEGRFPVLIHVKFLSKVTAWVCRPCYQSYKKRGLIKKVLRNV